MVEKENNKIVEKDTELEDKEEMAKRYRYTPKGVEVRVPSYTKKDGTRVKSYWRIIDPTYLKYIAPSGSAVIEYRKSARRKKRR